MDGRTNNVTLSYDTYDFAELTGTYFAYWDACRKLNGFE